MRFHNRQHRHYCGIDLHVKTMFVCILDGTGQVLAHRNVPSTPEALLEVVAPYRDDLVVAAECMFTWYWLADVCASDLRRRHARPRRSRRHHLAKRPTEEFKDVLTGRAYDCVEAKGIMEAR